jgi:hypothetical protein
MYAGWIVYYAYPHLVYDGQPEELALWVERLYPRFRIEALRLGETEMKRLIRQMIFRIDFLVLSVWLTIFYRAHIKVVLKDLMFKISRTVHLLRIWQLYFALMAFYTVDLSIDLWQLESIKVFYKPGILLKHILSDYPPLLPLMVFCTFCILLCIYLAWPVRKTSIHFWLGGIAWVVFVSLQHLAFSFEKTEHTYTTFNYFGLFMLPSILQTDNSGEYFKWNWPIAYARLAVVLVYTFAGLEKILISGLAFFKADTFRYFLSLHESEASKWLYNNDLLCTSLPIAAILLQLFGSWGLLWAPIRRWVAALMICFHLSTWLLLGVGGLLSPWIAVMIIFIADSGNE